MVLFTADYPSMHMQNCSYTKAAATILSLTVESNNVEIELNQYMALDLAV